MSAIARRAMDRISVHLPLDELVADLSIAERVTILRDGRKVGTFPSTEVDDERLGELMTGTRVEQTRYQGRPTSEQSLLEVRNLSKQGYFEDVNLALRPGEILGITGLLGSGRTDLALALFGINPADTGEIVIDSRPVTVGSVEDAIQAGIGFVPEDRLAQGRIMEQSVGKNIVANRCWSDAMFRLFAIPRAVFPEVGPSDDIIGTPNVIPDEHIRAMQTFARNEYGQR